VTEASTTIGRVQVGDERVRNVLRERWGPGPLIGWLGMNPSDASEERTDPTWMRWRGFAERWGFGGQIVCNPVPFRSANPDDAIEQLRFLANARMGTWWFAEGAQAMQHNYTCMKAIADEPVAWVCGWGDKGAAMNEVVRVHRPTIKALRDGGATLFLTFGLTKSGNPKHVLARGTSRIPDDAGLYMFHPESRKLGSTFSFADLAYGEPR
jgi:hypothetical protein